MQEHPVSNPALGSARELFDAGQYAGVVAVCCQALERHPAEVPLLLQRARAWIALGRNAQAIDDLREVLALDPLCGSAYLALGRLLVNGGQLLAARRAFHGALALDPGEAQARAQLEAVEAALIVEEALALETALADEPHEAAATRSMRRRLPTQPMGRSATGAVWRAPTLPLARPAGERSERNERIERGRARRAELPLGEASDRAAGAPTAAVVPVEHAVSRALLRRADTAPLTRTRGVTHGGAHVVHTAESAGHGRAPTAPFPRRAATVPAYGRPFSSSAAPERVDHPELDERSTEEPSGYRASTVPLRR